MNGGWPNQPSSPISSSHVLARLRADNTCNRLTFGQNALSPSSRPASHRSHLASALHRLQRWYISDLIVPIVASSVGCTLAPTLTIILYSRLLA